MNIRLIGFALVAMLGLVTVFLLTRSFLQQAGQPVPTNLEVEEKTTEILVAARDLPRGTILGPDDVRWQEWPEEAIQDNFILREEEEADYISQVIRAPIAVATPLSRTFMVAPGERGFMAAVLGPDMRAVTVSISEVSGVSGFIFPGDRVDLILTHTIEDIAGVRHTVSETIIQNARVLALDQRSEASDQEPALAETATLELPPKLAERVAIIDRMGDLTLALRSLSDKTAQQGVTVPVGVTLSTTLDSQVSRVIQGIQMQENLESDEVRVLRGIVTREKDGGN